MLILMCNQKVVPFILEMIFSATRLTDTNKTKYDYNHVATQKT